MASPHRQTIAVIRDRSRRVRGFWQRVTGGFELEQLWGQFLSEARASYGLFSHDVDWDRIDQSPKRWQKPFRITWALFLAMLMKLTPARRVLLLLAIVLVLVQGEIHFGKSNFTLDLTWIGAAVLFLILALELADRVTMKRDLEIAREIQQWLVPERPPDVPGINIAFATRPQNTVAGDCYDAFLRPDNGSGEAPLVVAVADVAGKSVPAALLMATFQASLRALAGTHATLEENVKGLDRYARSHNLEGRRFTTAFIAEIDPVTGAAQYVNAGHNAPILLRASGAVERLENGGPPLGLPLFRGKEPSFDRGSIQLNAGDLLFIFTDGVIDAVNRDGEEFGEAKLLSLLPKLPKSNAADLRDRVMSELNDFVGDAHQQDDITCLFLCVTERQS
ncbi:MAG TPA: PP2C family protein-serine/threonine phosphatase [Candidatus Acidoferrum sp.]|jgi:sigma-B regulation protein RsbU (phosphoserine phosphatase)|nr:PP2C family protein-serine/threonine phosphatase [Candidatus Acidoferrum sp.]